MKQIDFTIRGEAGPLGSHVVGRRRNGSAFVRHASKRGEAWRDLVAGEALVARAQRNACATLIPPYHVHLVVYELEPEGNHKWAWPTRADLDKIIRATLDGLTQGRLIEDDKHVISLEASTAFTADYPYATLRVRALREE